MSGNVFEWQANYRNNDHDVLGLRGGSWYFDEVNARVSIRDLYDPGFWYYYIGFRLVVSLPNGRS